MNNQEHERHERAYGEGRREAEDAGLIDDIFHGLDEIFGTVVPETTEHQSHERGYRDGRKEKTGW